MKFVLANWGTRGEVEPYVAVGSELVRRGHDVRMAVAPEMVDFVESAGPTAVAYGPDLKVILISGYYVSQQVERRFLRKPFRMRDLEAAVRDELSAA